MKVAFIAAQGDGRRYSCDERCYSRVLRATGYLLSSLLLSALSLLGAKEARAEAPPSQEFWNYMIEFGDAQGEVFDPSDYAAVANIPDKARAEFNRAQVNSTSAEMPASTLRETTAASSNANSAQEQPQ